MLRQYGAPSHRQILTAWTLSSVGQLVLSWGAIATPPAYQIWSMNWDGPHSRTDAELLTLPCCTKFDLVCTNNLTMKLQPAVAWQRRGHTYQYVQPRCRTQYRQQPFLPQTIQDWNNLPQSTVEATTIDIFLSRASKLAFFLLFSVLQTIMFCSSLVCTCLELESFSSLSAPLPFHGVDQLWHLLCLLVCVPVYSSMVKSVLIYPQYLKIICAVSSCVWQHTSQVDTSQTTFWSRFIESLKMMVFVIFLSSALGGQPLHCVFDCFK